jgi:hypothetical protein
MEFVFFGPDASVLIPRGLCPEVVYCGKYIEVFKKEESEKKVRQEYREST